MLHFKSRTSLKPPPKLRCVCVCVECYRLYFHHLPVLSYKGLLSACPNQKTSIHQGSHMDFPWQTLRFASNLMQADAKSSPFQHLFQKVVRLFHGGEFIPIPWDRIPIRQVQNHPTKNTTEIQGQSPPKGGQRGKQNFSSQWTSSQVVVFKTHPGPMIEQIFPTGQFLDHESPSQLGVKKSPKKGSKFHHPATFIAKICWLLLGNYRKPK